MTDTIELWADNTTGTLSAPALSGAESIGVATTTGTFPTPTSGQVFHIVINFGAVNAELAEVTANVSGTFTLAADLANDHDAAETVALVITKEGLDSMVAESILISTIEAAGDMVVGTGAHEVGRLPIGTAGQVLKVGGSDPSGIEWAPLPTSLPPSGPAGGDLGGTFPDPSVDKVNGIAVSGTPAVGDGLFATSSSAAAWSAPNSIDGVVVTGTAASGKILTATGASAATWEDPASGGAAGGDLGGTFPDPSVVAIDGVAISGGAPSAGEILVASSPSIASWSASPIGGPLIHDSNALSGGNVTLATATDTVVLTTDSLDEGTWLITVNGLVKYGASATGVILVYLNPDTATVTSFAGQQGAQLPDPTAMGSSDPVPFSFQCVAVVSAAGTIDITAHNYDATVAGTAMQFDSLTNNAFTYTAIRMDQAGPGGTAGGDLDGSYPDPSVVQLQGTIALSGTPSAGQILMASSPTAADWEDAPGGALTFASDSYTGGPTTIGPASTMTFDTASLAEGTWLISLTVCAGTDFDTQGSLLFALQEDTATASFDGPSSYEMAAANGYASGSLTCIAEITAPGTLQVYLQNTDGTLNWYLQSTDPFNSTTCTAYTAVKIA